MNKPRIKIYLDYYDNLHSACYFGSINGEYTHTLHVTYANTHNLNQAYREIFSNMVNEAYAQAVMP